MPEPRTVRLAELALLVVPILLAPAVAGAGEVPDAADPTLAPGGQMELSTLLTAVLERNPDLAAARRAWEAAASEAPQVSVLPDPEVSYGVGPLSIFSDDVDLGQVLEARQGIPYPGKLRLRGEAAEAMAGVERRRFEELSLDLTRLAAERFYDLYLLDRALEINREHVRLLEELKEIATVRYASGLVAQQVPLQAEVELTHLIHREMTLETRRSVVVARLNALLHRPPHLPLPAPVPLAAADPAVELAAGEQVAALAERAVAARPELAAAAAEIRARDVERELAALERKPDFGVMASYNSMWASLEHQLMVGMSVRLPVRKQRLDALEAEAAARWDSARLRRDALADRVRSEVVQAAERLAEMAHVVDLYEARLLPAARDQLRAARSGFETGEVSFLAVVEAEKSLRSVELSYEEALTDRHRRRADLERALGLMPGSGLNAGPGESRSSLPGPQQPETTDSPNPNTDGLAADAAGGAR